MLGKNKKENGNVAKCRKLFSVTIIVAMVLGGFLGIISTDIGSRSASAATTTIMTEDFQGTFPSTGWSCGDLDSDSGYDYWDDRGYNGYGSSWSAYCGAEGAPYGRSASRDKTNSNDVDIPDNDDRVTSCIDMTDLPSDALVKAGGMGVRIDYLIQHTYVGDLWVYVATTEDAATVWDREGGTTDQGYDDDTEDDNDIDEYEDGNGDLGDVFDGTEADRLWWLCAQDMASGDTGYIDEWWLDIYYTSHKIYDNDMDAYMKYGSFSLSGYTTATLEYDYWLDVEDGCDYLYVEASSDNSNWDTLASYSSGYDSHDGDTNAKTWFPNTEVSLDDYCGDSSVWIRFLFDSDGSVYNREGAYIDNVEITAETPADDSYEENDDSASAALVSAGSYYDLYCQDDDWYKIYLNNRETITVDIYFTHADGDIDMKLYDTDATTLLDSSTSSTDDEQVSATVDSSGYYYIKVYPYGGAMNDYDMTITVEAGDDSYEENDDSASAYEVSAGSYYDLYCKDDDWYKIDLDSGDTITVDIYFTHADGDIDMKLYDTDATTLLDSSTSSTDDEQVSATVDSSGYYYIKVYPYGGAMNDYDMTITVQSGDSYEPDNTYSDARIITSGSTQTHSIKPVGDEDWVKFTLAERSDVVLETSGPYGSMDDTRMWLYNSGLTELAYNDDTIEYFSKITETLDAGTYYVKIDDYNDNDVIDTYYISFDASPAAPTPPPSGFDMVNPSGDIVVGTGLPGGSEFLLKTTFDSISYRDNKYVDIYDGTWKKSFWDTTTTATVDVDADIDWSVGITNGDITAGWSLAALDNPTVNDVIAIIPSMPGMQLAGGVTPCYLDASGTLNAEVTISTPITITANTEFSHTFSKELMSKYTFAKPIIVGPVEITVQFWLEAGVDVYVSGEGSFTFTPEFTATLTSPFEVEYSTALDSLCARVETNPSLSVTWNADYHPSASISTDITPYLHVGVAGLFYNIIGPSADFGPAAKVHDYYDVIDRDHNGGIYPAFTGSIGADVVGIGRVWSHPFEHLFSPIVTWGSPASPAPPAGMIVYAPASPSTGSAVTFNATLDNYGDVIMYKWNFGDGSSDEIYNTPAEPTHTYTEKGAYRVILTLEDNEGLTRTLTEWVTVGMPALTSDAHQEGTVALTTPGTPSGNVDKFNIAWSWAAPVDMTSVDGYRFQVWNGSSIVYQTLLDKSVTSFAVHGLSSGDYTARVCAVNHTYDRESSWSPESTVIKVNSPPMAGFTYTPRAVTETAGIITFNGAESADPDGSIVSYNWDFGDGNTSSGVEVSHYYLGTGAYTVTLTVIDDDGATDSMSITLYYTDLVAHYSMDEGSGTDLYDSSAFDNHGTISGATWTTDAITGGQALYFDGSDYVQVPDDDSLDIQKAITIEAWVKRDTTGNALREIVRKGSYGLPNYMLLVDSWWGGKFRLEYDDGSAYYLLSTVDGSCAANTWYHVVGIIDPNTQTMKIYINGELARSMSCGGIPITNDAPLYIGGRTPNSVLSLTIDEVKIYDPDLSAEEIMDRYMAGKHPPIAGFTHTSTADLFQFTDASIDSDGAISSWSWDFGDGTTSTLQNPTHQYTFAGTYIVRLTVTDDDGKTGTVSRSVTIIYYPLDNEGVITGPSGPISWNYEMGYRFTPNVDGCVTQLGFWGTGDGDTKTCNLWTDGGTKLASVSVTDRTAGFSYAPITPVLVTTGTYYRVSVSVASANGYYQSYSTPRTIGDITIASTCYQSPSGSFPSYTYTSYMYGIADIGFEPRPLVAQYHFDENTGTTAYDSSGNGNDGTIYGASWVSGKYDSALSFDGVDDYVSVPHSPELDITYPITIEAWVNLGGSMGYYAPIAIKRSYDGSYHQPYAFVIENGNHLAFYAYSTGGEWVYHSSSTTLSQGVWYHVAYTYDGSTIKFYINGAEDYSAAETRVFTNSDAPVLIGKYPDVSSWIYNGCIDEVRIFNSALTNIKSSATPSSSGGGSGTYGPASMIDGNTGTFCWVWAGSSPSTAYFQLEWSSAHTIDHIDIDTSAGTRTCNVGSIQYWDGSSWVTVGSAAGKTDDWSFSFGGVSTTKIRLYGAYAIGTQASNPLIYEWDVYAGNVPNSQPANPGFESTGGWATETIGSSYAPTMNLQSTDGPHAGSFCARMDNNLGSLGTPRAGYITQEIALSSTASTLSYYMKYWKATWGPGMGVRIKDSSGNVLLQNNEGTGGTSSSSGWVQRTFDVSAYAGQTVTIEVYLEDLSTTWAGNGDHGGWIGVDDFSVA